MSLTSPAVAGEFFTARATREVRAWLLDGKFLEGSLMTASSHRLQRSALALCGRAQENWQGQLAECQSGVRERGAKDG